MKKDILFVVDERMMGGVSVVINDLLHFLDYDKYNVDLLVLHDNGDMLNDLPPQVNLFFGSSFFKCVDYTIKEVLQKKDISLLLSKIQLVMGMKTGSIKKRIIKERKKMKLKEYDVEIAFKDGFCAIFTAYGNAKKKIHWLHCSYATFNPNEKYPELFKDVLSKFDSIAGVATNVVKEFNDIYHLEDKTEVIPVAMGVDRIKLLASDDSKVKLDKNKLNLICLGRMHPVKGYDRLMNVFHKLNQIHLLNNVELHMFGDGPLLEKIQLIAKEYKLNDIVKFEGLTRNPYAELKCYDALLLPSYSEAFGTVISEAFILGVPVFATRTSASEMSIKQDINGWICENDEKSIYQGLKVLLENRYKINECRNNLIGFEYQNETILNRIDELFSK